MRFYKATVKPVITDYEESDDKAIKESRRSASRESAAHMADDVKSRLGAGEEFNLSRNKVIYCFISYIGAEVSCGVISDGSADVKKTLIAYLNTLGISTVSVSIQEVTFSSVRNLLGHACRNDFIEDDDAVLEKFDLERLSGRYYRGVPYGENLLDASARKEDLYSVSEEYLANDTLRPELDRIYSGTKNSKAFGHPVHYMIETNGRDARRELTRAVLQALYDNGRLRSRRYCFLDLAPGRDLPRHGIDCLYKSCKDGAVVVRYNANDDDEDDDRVSADIETVGVICDMMMKYRNQVLTVFCLPREGERTKKIFYENLGSVGLIEIREDLADFEKSCDYLKFLCKKQHIRPDKKLFGKLEDDKMYLPDDLRTTFDEWYNVKMKTTVFPQYKEVSACRKEAVKEAPKGSAYDELNEMIGLTEAKSVIEKALAYYKIQRIYKDKGIKQDRAAMHMVFTGNPGTAKTTVARLFARIMKENGLLSRGHLVEVGRSDLVGKYVGWTAPTVKEKFKAAAGGVLFIDEAYSLVDDRGGLYGDEAINTIVQEMENRREDLVVIFAGYPDKMEEFLCKNPGLRSRIAFHVPFADYNTEELCDIARMIGKSKGVSFSGKAMDKLSVLFDCVRMQDDFGNGRYVRNLIELSKMNQACRILGKDPETVTEKALTMIEEEEIELLTPETKNPARQIGFAV